MLDLAATIRSNDHHPELRQDWGFHRWLSKTSAIDVE
jgi:hypothetical protein